MATINHFARALFIGWAEAVAGCTYVLHVASPFPTESPKDKNELIRPAVDGTLHVLRACHAASPRPKVCRLVEGEGCLVTVM